MPGDAGVAAGDEQTGGGVFDPDGDGAELPDHAAFTKWDRKSYYYPDLPKNYQISQYDLPIGQHGFIEIPLAKRDRSSGSGILRAHLEEDAGKNMHTFGNFSAIDLNRAGTPLLEIVTEPDLNSPAEVRALAPGTAADRAVPGRVRGGHAEGPHAV